MEERNVALFSEDSLISQFKGVGVQVLVVWFKAEWRLLDNKKLHSIRSHILSTPIMLNTKSMSCELKTVHFHTDYKFCDQFQAAILLSCPVYHRMHIRYIAEQISAKGELVCQQCKKECRRLGDVIVDALSLGIYDQARRYQMGELLFRRREIGVIGLERQVRGAEESRLKAVVLEQRENISRHFIVQVQFWQIVKDPILQNLSIQAMIMQLQALKDKSSTLPSRFSPSPTPILTNSICFISHVRICNPLFHQLCSSDTHNQRLVLYSFQNIYHEIFVRTQRKGRVACPYYNCKNYFDADNFSKCAVVLDKITRNNFQERRQNLFGMYVSGVLFRDWHCILAENWLLQYLNIGEKGVHILPQIRGMIGQLITTANLRGGVQKSAKISKKIAVQHSSRSLQGQEIQQNYNQQVITVKLGQFNYCPVRCFKCRTLDALDGLLMAFVFQREQKKVRRCPLCNSEIKKKQFYDVFYIDLELMKFMFFEGHASEILFNISSKKYFHKATRYTGKNLRQKLKQQNRIDNQPIPQSAFNLKLDNSKQYVPVIDQRCKVKYRSQAIKHFCFIPQNQSITNSLHCPQCQTTIRLDKLLYHEDLEWFLRKNQLSINYNLFSQNPNIQKQKILSLRSYNDITHYLSPQIDETPTFYWKNYQGSLIKYPFVFRGCKHPLQTRICDFSDIQYQIRSQGAALFQCRFIKCENIYEFVDDLQRIQLDLYSRIQQNQQLKSQIVTEGSYWITYSLYKGTISCSKRKIEGTSEQQDIQQRELYRSKLGRQNRMAIQREIQRKNKTCPNRPNFTAMARQYPNQLKTLMQKAVSTPTSVYPVSFQHIKTYGNLHLFPHAIPQQPPSPYLQPLQRIVQAQSNGRHD